MKFPRRNLVKAGVSLPFINLISGTSHAAEKQANSTPPHSPINNAFHEDTVLHYAQKLAQAPYQAPSQTLPPQLSNLTFDQFSSIQYRSEKALWSNDKLAFDIEFFPRGYLYRPEIEMFEVVDGQAQKIAYDADLFHYNDPALKVSQNIGFSGLKIRYALNHPDIMEECAVFLGASYFRAIAKGQTYGLSARGFAKDTGLATGEEFPLFRAFWLEKPKPGMRALILHALMDSPSLTGAFRFTIRPGDTTLFDVHSTLFPRHDIEAGGIAPLTGMYYFDANNHAHINDWRPAAHDSEALQIWTGANLQLYRPLTNPTDLQLSAFTDSSPYGYGLMQRKRDFNNYQDLTLHYEKCPSLWIEPIGKWQEGAITLVEIPTPSEVNDNIVAFWRPKEPLRAGKAYNFTYRMYWGWDSPWPSTLARVIDTRLGAVIDHPEAVQFVLDFAGSPFDTLPPDTPYHLVINTHPGIIKDIVLKHNPETNGVRAFFKLIPQDATLCELTAQLTGPQGTLSETWMYRWTL